MFVGASFGYAPKPAETGRPSGEYRLDHLRFQGGAENLIEWLLQPINVRRKIPVGLTPVRAKAIFNVCPFGDFPVQFNQFRTRCTLTTD
jgi:hypothetical protein